MVTERIKSLMTERMKENSTSATELAIESKKGRKMEFQEKGVI
jgi:hypothetical protein